MRKKRIGIVAFDYQLGYQPVVINSALILEREGYEVHIFIDTPSYEESKISFGDTNVTIHPIDRRESPRDAEPTNGQTRSFIATVEVLLRALPRHGALLRSLYRQTAWLYWKLYLMFYQAFYNRGSPSEKRIKQTSDFFPALFDFQKTLAQSIDSEYVCLLGIDANGLVAATMIAENGSQDRRIPVIYYNMELLLVRYAHTLQMQALTSLEQSCIKSCHCVVIQDEKRAAHFLADNKLPPEKIVYLPVSGLRAPYQGKSTYLRDLLNISADQRILLHAGAIMDYGMCLELAEAANNWGDNLVLVLHSALAPQTLHFDSGYVDKVKRAAHANKVFLSLNPVPWDKVPELISSADIGLMFYKNKDKDPNFYEIGQSSNKLVQYLQAGLPVITTNFPSLRSVTQGCQCGESTEDLNEISALADRILTDYATYRNNAFKCYTEKYSLSRYFDVVIERIRQLELR